MVSRMKHITFALLMLLLMPAVTVNAQQSLLYYILDGSGSMWGRVNGKLKIQIAKDVMTTLINETPTDIHCGIMVYGHRKKGDCKDIEIIVPIGPLNKEAAIGKIRSITPKGKTPISSSISMAFENIRATEYASTIVLVSDGIETCGSDPCLVTRSLKESGINFIMHAVGFGVKSDAAKQLSCIAEAGGGKYFSTTNAADLLTALNRIKESVVEKKEIEPPPATEAPPPEPEPIKQQVSKSSTSIRIKASGPGRVSIKADPWLKAPYYWKLIDPETGEEKARFRGLEEQLVPPGEYQVVWRQSEHGSRELILGEVISVESRKTTGLILKTGIRIVTPAWVKQPRFWGLQDLSTKKTIVSFKPTTTQLVPSGEYNLVWRQSEHGSDTLTLAKINIEPDKVTDVALATALNLVPADWVPPRLRYWEIQDTKSATTVARFRDGFQPNLVPAGTYRVVYRKGEHNSTDSYLGDITIKEGKMNEFPLNTGVKLIPQPGMKPPYQIVFIELDQSGKETRKVFLSGSFDPMPLKPGRYKITYRQTQHTSGTITLVESFDLPAGNLVEVEL